MDVFAHIRYNKKLIVTSMNISTSPYFYFLACILLLLPLTSYAQRQVLTVSPDALFALNELKAIIIDENDQAVVKLIMPGADASDLKEGEKLIIGDKILFANGEVVENVSDLKKIYEGLEIGNELSLGIQRGEERRIIRIVKQAAGESGLKTFSMSAGQSIQSTARTIDGARLNLTRLSSLGITVIKSDMGLQITALDSEKLHDDLKGQDILLFTITEIDGKKVSSPADLSDAYNELEAGKTMELRLEKNGQSKVITVTKRQN